MLVKREEAGGFCKPAPIFSWGFHSCKMICHRMQKPPAPDTVAWLMAAFRKGDTTAANQWSSCYIPNYEGWRPLK